jgi:ribonuclease BN (tRNA processing enzyme)
MTLRKFIGRILLFLLSMYFCSGATVYAETSTPALELVVLGSGGPGATGRAASSYLVLIDGTPRILVDAGPGSFARLGEAKLSLSETDLVLLTHLHVDHAGELPGLFKARAVSSGDSIVFKVWGPAGSGAKHEGAYFPSTSRFLELMFGKHGAFAYLSDFAAPIAIQAHNIPAQLSSHLSPHVIFKEGALVVTAIAGHHLDAPAVVYRVEYAGKSITFSGDIDAKGLPGLRSIAKRSDLLVFNCVVLDPPGSRAVLYSLHTPPRAIGEVSKDAGVHHLLLSHLSPAVEENRDAVLESIHQNYMGSVSFAEDGMRLSP